MNQDEQKKVDMVLSEIQSILAELPPIHKTPVEQTNALAMVVSEFEDLNAEPRVESKSAIPLTTHHVQNSQNDLGTSDAAFAQEVEALLGISVDRDFSQMYSGCLLPRS
jgi:hypothetical protein